MSWPPERGALLPNAERAYGLEEKLASYSLKLGHVGRGRKAEGFARVLAVTLADLDYLAGTLSTGFAPRRCPAFAPRAGTASTAR